MALCSNDESKKLITNKKGRRKKKIRLREGDFIETVEGLFFDVKGLLHPPHRIIAFIRYFPDKRGRRKKEGVTYSKIYSLSEKYKFLKERFPQYLVYNYLMDEIICEVPIKNIKKYYNPIQKLQELRNSKGLDTLEKKAVNLARSLKKEANIPWSSIGISGSILVGLHTLRSDIDPIVYGIKNCRKVHSVLRTILKAQNEFKPYTRDELRALFDFRSKDTVVSFKNFIKTEKRKILQGKFMGTDYFIRFVKNWSEIGESCNDIQYENVGSATIKARIVDGSESIFTPCTYKIENITNENPVNTLNFQPILDIVSFRGRFCELAEEGETIIAQGKIELVKEKTKSEYYRIILGNRSSDYMVLK